MAITTQTHYHQTLKQILLNLRKCAPCVVVPETTLDAEEPNNCFNTKTSNKPEYSERSLLEDNELILDTIVSYNFTRQDLCVCFGKKCHHIDFTPDKSLTPVWLLSAC